MYGLLNNTVGFNVKNTFHKFIYTELRVLVKYQNMDVYFCGFYYKSTYYFIYIDDASNVIDSAAYK